MGHGNRAHLAMCPPLTCIVIVHDPLVAGGVASLGHTAVGDQQAAHV